MIDLIAKDGVLQLSDRNTGCLVLDGTPISVSYTLLSDDITKGERKSETSPYESRQGLFNIAEKSDDRIKLVSDELKAVCSVYKDGKAVSLELVTERDDLSEFGLNLPFNFMGKLNCGGYKNQYLFSSAYRSIGEDYKFCFLKNVNGNDLVVLFDSEADGWKMDYSPYVGGHYFVNLKCLANFDKVYNTGSKRKKLKIKLFTCKGYNDGLKKVSDMLDVPAAYYEKSYSFDGKGRIEFFGECDEVREISGGKERAFKVIDNYFDYETESHGKVSFVPYRNGKRGFDCSVFIYGDLTENYKKANDAMLSHTLNEGNLCECQCWASAMLRYMQKFGKDDRYIDRLNCFFDLIMAHDSTKAIARLSVLDVPYQDYPAYHIFKSKRIQEQDFGISIFLDAYKVFGEEKYLTYARNTLDTFIECYQKPDGRIETWQNDRYEDYSTVTCLIIPIVDMALFYKDKDASLYQKYYNSAYRLAKYVYDRGFSFPTEGGDSPLAEEQIEDGSVSCSALTLLYFCAKLERREEFIVKAKDILDFHDNWQMYNHDANCYHSSLRWWETRWEGDGDGPALCCGHAWTIWRAEADFWYYFLTDNKEYLRRSICAFTTNFAKFDKDGKGKSIYNVDYITGGGFGTKSDVKYRIAPRFPDREDIKTARYAYSRAAETIFRLSLKELNG